MKNRVEVPLEVTYCNMVFWREALLLMRCRVLGTKFVKVRVADCPACVPVQKRSFEKSKNRIYS